MEAFVGAAPRGATSLAAGCVPQLLQAGPKLAPQPTGRASVQSGPSAAHPVPCRASRLLHLQPPLSVVAVSVQGHSC